MFKRFLKSKKKSPKKVKETKKKETSTKKAKKVSALPVSKTLIPIIEKNDKILTAEGWRRKKAIS